MLDVTFSPPPVTPEGQRAQPDPDKSPDSGREQDLWVLLRSATRPQHRAVEDALGLPGSVRGTADLVDVLARLAAVWSPLEQSLAGVRGWDDLGLDPHLGEAGPLLEQDLAALGPAPGTGPATVPAVPGVRTLSHAIGGRYVLLGSALGGRVVAPAVERRLGLPVGHGTAFFRREGQDPGAQWHRFRAAVSARPALWTADAVLAGAVATFDALLAVTPTATP